MRSRVLVLLLCVTVALALPAGALASTVRYVSTTGKDSPGCNPSACKTIKYAIGQAAAGDTISIGPGTFEEGELKVEGKALDFVGAGAGTASTYEATHDTFIDGAKDPLPTITDTAGGSFSDLRIEGGVSDSFVHIGTRSALALGAAPAPGGSGSVSYALQEIVVTEPTPPIPPPGEPAENEAAISLRGNSAALETTTVSGLSTVGAESGLSSGEYVNLSLTRSTLNGSTPEHGIGITVFGGSANIQETTVTGAENGVNVAGGGSLTAVRDRFSGRYEGLYVQSVDDAGTSSASVRDSLIEALPTEDDGTPTAVDVLAGNDPGETASLTSVGSTFATYGKGANAGLRVYSQSGDSATAQLFNTIVYGEDPTAPGRSVDIFGEGPGTAMATATASSYTTVKSTAGATITAPGSAGNITGNPGFTNPAKDEFTLTSASPLLERGDPSQVLAGELDLAGNPRIDGNCRPGKAPDIGAYELALGTCSSVGSSTGTNSSPTATKTGLAGSTISKLSFSPPRRATHGKHAKRAKAGVLAFTLKEAATVKVELTQRVTVPVQKELGCLGESANIAKVRTCQRIVLVDKLKVSERAGHDTIVFPGVKLLKRMKPGRYEVILTIVSGTGPALQTVAFKLS